MSSVYCVYCKMFVEPRTCEDKYNESLGLPARWEECPMCGGGDIKQIVFITCRNCESRFNTKYVEIYDEDKIFTYCPVCDADIVEIDGGR